MAPPTNDTNNTRDIPRLTRTVMSAGESSDKTVPVFEQLMDTLGLLKNIIVPARKMNDALGPLTSSALDKAMLKFMPSSVASSSVMPGALDVASSYIQAVGNILQQSVATEGRENRADQGSGKTLAASSFYHSIAGDFTRGLSRLKARVGAGGGFVAEALAVRAPLISPVLDIGEEQSFGVTPSSATTLATRFSKSQGEALTIGGISNSNSHVYGDSFVQKQIATIVPSFANGSISPLLNSQLKETTGLTVNTIEPLDQLAPTVKRPEIILAQTINKLLPPVTNGLTKDGGALMSLPGATETMVSAGVVIDQQLMSVTVGIESLIQCWNRLMGMVSSPTDTMKIFSGFDSDVISDDRKQLTVGLNISGRLDVPTGGITAQVGGQGNTYQTTFNTREAPTARLLNDYMEHQMV